MIMISCRGGTFTLLNMSAAPTVSRCQAALKDKCRAYYSTTIAAVFLKLLKGRQGRRDRPPLTHLHKFVLFPFLFPSNETES